MYASRSGVPRRGIAPSDPMQTPMNTQRYMSTFKEPSVISFHRRDNLLSQPDPPIFVRRFQSYRGIIMYEYHDANTGEPYYYSGPWETTHN